MRRQSLQLWGGVECTVNRVGNEFFDQLQRGGHAERLADLDLFAELGLKAIRYPILWERIVPDGLQKADWHWADERLGRLRELGINPIVGLVHHGSGPRDTNLADPAFPERLAEFAGAVAARYPWLTHFTPVNEPLTTARFSGLYGHWYPHARDNLSFLRILLNECKAVSLSMRAIRKVNPQAQLVQTEDLGKVFSTPALGYQADFENVRRWLTFDLLVGRIATQHPIWSYMKGSGITEAEIEWFQANPCPPDILGLNYYLTSERFLDDRVDLYPPHTHGSNGRDVYADVEAVRVREEGIGGPRLLLQETWQRYGIPLAITEAHLGCTREEQLRWLMEVWTTAESLLTEKAVDIRAVTAWSLLGAYDWDSLVTRADNHYEPGVFDLRAPTPRPTALAKLLKQLGRGEQPSSPILDGSGWWKRPQRHVFGFTIPGSKPVEFPGVNIQCRVSQEHSRQTSLRPLMITGAGGSLEQAVAHFCEIRGIPTCRLLRQSLDKSDSLRAFRAAFEQIQPWAVINTAGFFSQIDLAETQPTGCFEEVTLAPTFLAEICAEQGLPLLNFSSDQVFDGEKTGPYLESDRTAPLNLYGKCQQEAEKAVLDRWPEALIIRTGGCFGPWDDQNFVYEVLEAGIAGQTFYASADEVISLSFIPDLVQSSLDLLIDGEHGIWHLTNQGATNWLELAHQVAKSANLDPIFIQCCSTRDVARIAPRPAYSVLGSERGWPLPSLESALQSYCQECQNELDARRLKAA